MPPLSQLKRRCIFLYTQVEGPLPKGCCFTSEAHEPLIIKAGEEDL